MSDLSDPTQIDNKLVSVVTTLSTTVVDANAKIGTLLAQVSIASSTNDSNGVETALDEIRTQIALIGSASISLHNTVIPSAPAEEPVTDDEPTQEPVAPSPAEEADADTNTTITPAS